MHRLMMHPRSPAHGKERRLFRYASSIRARPTRLAGSVRDRAIAFNRAKSSSSIVNACRHAVMIFNLVSRITDEATSGAVMKKSQATDQIHGIGRPVGC
jgi:hypothetical protein